MPKLSAESIRRKREKLEAELEALRKKERSSADERNAIAGRALLDHALKDEAFAAEVMRILDRALTKRTERVLFGLSVSARKPRRSSVPDALTPASEPRPTGEPST